MFDIWSFVFTFIIAALFVIILGVITGFSPILYITQVAIGTKPKKRMHYTIALTAGIFTAALLLVILFQSLNLDVLLRFIDTSIRALTVSVIFNIIFGLCFIWAGWWYMHARETASQRQKAVQHASGYSAIFGLGFIRTFLSISGVIAAYIAATFIAQVSVTLFDQFILTTIFFAATVAPFLGIMQLVKVKPELLNDKIEIVKAKLEQWNYKTVIGTVAIILGWGIVGYNIIIALLY